MRSKVWLGLVGVLLSVVITNRASAVDGSGSSAFCQALCDNSTANGEMAGCNCSAFTPPGSGGGSGGGGGSYTCASTTCVIAEGYFDPYALENRTRCTTIDYSAACGCYIENGEQCPWGSCDYTG